MNLRKFLLQVDALTEQMTVDQLKAVIHENGRLLSEAKRSDYLDRLKLFLSEPQSGTVNEAEKKLKIAEEFKKECVRLQKEICKIEEGELCIESEPNYEYNEWGDSDDEVFFQIPMELEMLLKTHISIFINVLTAKNIHMDIKLQSG